MVKISVIMAAYNVEQYIQKAIDSVLGQNYSNYELIIVDDGSTDNTGLICDQYTKRDLPIKVIHQENAGQSVARNVGIDYAESDYICFLDSDDWFSANIFNVYNETINKYNPDIVQVSIFNVSDESSFYVPKDEIIEYNQKESLYKLIKNSDLPNKETLYKEYCCKVNNIFKSKSIFRWCFKDIKRYIVFTMLPKIYESIIYRQ